MAASLTAADVLRVRDSLSSLTDRRGAEETLAGMARGAALLCRTPLASVAVLTSGRDHLEVRSVFGTGGVIVEKRLPVVRSLNGTVLTSGRSFRSTDVWRDQRAPVRDIARRNRVRGLLIVPLSARERFLGTLAVARRGPWAFSARDEALLEEFTARASTALALVPPRVRAARESPPGRERTPSANGHRLTPRERDIVALLIADMTCRDVASTLGLSAHTVRHHVERMKLRFGKTTLHGLVSALLSGEV
jgi:DNA-binding CsgD family transcriptional regulator/putative methionine-R-sulfoxide reductase with GAF domain